MSDYVNNTETITIEKLNSYGGGKVNGKTYNLGKKYTGPALEVGTTYEVNVSTSPNGAKYVNEARKIGKTAPISNSQTANKSSRIANTTTSGPTVTVENNPPRVNGSSLSPTEKDTRILVQGVLQAVAQAPALVNSENFKEDVKSITTEFVDFIRNFK